MSTRDKLVAEQIANVARLECELAELIAAGNEYYASFVREDIVAAKSPARLVHKG